MSTSTSARRCRSASASPTRSPRARLLSRSISAGPLARALAEEQRRAQRRRPQPVGAAEQRGQRLAQLLGAERLVLEEGQLPAVERLAELGVGVRRRRAARRGRPRGAPGTRRAGSARRRAGSPRSAAPGGRRAAASRAARTGRARRRPAPPVASRSAVTTSAISPGASGGSTARGGERLLELEHAQAVGLAAEAGGQQAARLRPEGGELAASPPGAADAAAELELRREPRSRRPA